MPTAAQMAATSHALSAPPGWVPRTWAIGLAYFSGQMGAALYNAYLPIFYGAFVAGNLLIGVVMIIDNIASLTLQPYFAGLSDRVDTRLGRRMPFLLAGIPVAALFFLLIPRARSFWPLLGATIMVNVGGAVFNSPGYALMPDITPRPLRGRANGILNLMGGLGALVAFFALSSLYRRSRTLPFDVASGLLVPGGAVVLAVVASVAYIAAPILYRALLLVGGLGWALAITNAYPLLVDRVPPRQTGTFPGLWNAALALAGLISPPVYGLVVDAFGFGAFFIPGVVFMAAGLVSTLGIIEGDN